MAYEFSVRGTLSKDIFVKVHRLGLKKGLWNASSNA